MALAAAAHHASPVAVTLAVLAALAVYAAVVLVSPTRRCPKCHGHRVVIPKGGKRPRPCDHCRRTGRVPRIGSATVHRWLWSVLGDGLMERRRASMREDN